MNDILSQIIAYAPDKIDTDVKLRSLVQAPLTMAQVPRSEMDNFNTPDLDQGADSILKPGETLEDDFDVNFRKANAEGGRIPFGDGLSVDPERDSFKKISNVLGAYRRYRRGEKNPALNFNQFFELFSTENFATGGSAGQLVSNSVDGSRPGYSGLGGDKIPKSVLNKGAQYFYKVDYDNLKDDKELTKEKKRSKIYSKINDYYKRTGEYKFVVKTQETPLSKTDQAKILKEYPEAKFGPKRKYGFAPTDPEYQSVFKYVKDNFKTPYEGGMFKSLPKYSQKELIEAFPEVDFNFDRNIEFSTKGSQFSKYGVSVTHPKYAKISKYFAKSKPWKYKFDLRSPEGWMMSQMERASAQGNTEYKPITKNGKPIAKGNPMIGIEDNGEKYNMKTITDHPDFNNTKKYWNIADKTSRKYLTQFDNLATLLPEGFDPAKIQLNDLLQFISNKDGVKGLNRAKRAIEMHHEYGVKNKTTGSYQLLRQDVNLLANKANNLIKKGDLSNIEKGAAKALAEGVRLNVDGVQYGPKKVSATGDIKNILTGAETELKSFTKKDFKKFASELEKLGCGRAAGGRILFAEGVPGLTKCGKAGVAKLEKGLTNGFKKSDVGLAQKILSSSKFLKEAVSLRGLLGPAALAFTAAAEAGIVGYDMLASGKSFKEAIGSSVFNYALGDKTKIDSDEEFMKRLKDIKVGPQGYQRMGDAEIGKMLNFKTNLDDMKRGFDLYNKLGAITENKKQIGSNPEDAFNENAFQLDLDKQEDAVRADIQDFNRTNTPNKVTDYLLSDKAKEGANATAYANLLVKEDQLKNAGTGDALPKVDQGIARNLKQTQYDIDNLLNPKKLDEFGQMFINATPGEQSYFMGRTDFMEGGIASLNVKK